VKMDGIPSWYVSDSYVKEGYRRITNSWKGCLLSLSYWHNETGNVYTHGIGAICLFPVAFLLYTSWLNQVEHGYYDYFMHSIYLLGLLTCLSCSTVFHLCHCHSKSVSKYTNKMDYVGILALQVGSFIPIIHYGFYCHADLQQFYSYATLILGIFAMYVTVGPTYAAVQFRWLRTLLFSCFGLMGVVPCFHHISKYGFKMAIESFALREISIMAVLYIFGAMIYVARIPERWYPRTFDIVGSSHQIWHLFVLAAASAHFLSIFRMYKWWHTNNHTCSVSDEEMTKWFQ